MVKLAQHHRLGPRALPHNTLDSILSHTLDIDEKKYLVYIVNYLMDINQIEVSHMYTLAEKQFMLILNIPMVSNTNLLDLYKFLLAVDFLQLLCKSR